MFKYGLLKQKESLAQVAHLLCPVQTGDERRCNQNVVKHRSIVVPVLPVYPWRKAEAAVEKTKRLNSRGERENMDSHSKMLKHCNYLLPEDRESGFCLISSEQTIAT